MDVQKAWNLVKTKIKDVAVETAYELDDAFVFSIRPLGQEFGCSTGAVSILVNKNTGNVESLRSDDPKLLSGNTFTMLDPLSIK